MLLDLIKKEIKERKETREFYKVGNETYETLTLQIAELTSYLPQEMSEQQVSNIIKKEIEEMLKTGAVNKGRLIGATIKQTGDRFDKSKVNALVSKILQEEGL